MAGSRRRKDPALRWFEVTVRGRDGRETVRRVWAADEDAARAEVGDTVRQRRMPADIVDVRPVDRR
jgi:hypothetical protein